MVESTDRIGQSNFKKIKHFIKQIVNAFHISPTSTHVGFMSINERAKVNFGFERGSRSKKKVMEGINLVRFTRGRSTNIFKGFEAADDMIFGGNMEERANVNKVRYICC